jgi:NAD(P)-dependent dehydrogenase (short-subunit alcohol dehydrogenase family)
MMRRRCFASPVCAVPAYSHDMTDSGFDAHSTTDDVLAGVDLAGRVAAVTGGSGGLGLETGRALAVAGAHVILAARSADKLGAAIDTIRAAHPSASLEPLVLDLGDVGSCRRAANSLAAKQDRLDLLINNAGVMCTPFGRTADGFETQFGTNHLGHMAWTLPLLDLLSSSSIPARPSRIINLSSAGHRFGDVDFDDPNYERREYDAWGAYGQSKTANVLFSVGLEQRLTERGVRSAAVHPGGIHTDLGRHMTPEMRIDIQSRIKQSNPGGFEWKSVEQGAATTVWAATTPTLADSAGVYCEDCNVAAPDRDGVAGGVRASAVDPQRAAQLWERSEQLLAAV